MNENPKSALIPAASKITVSRTTSIYFHIIRFSSCIPISQSSPASIKRNTLSETQKLCNWCKALPAKCTGRAEPTIARTRAVVVWCIFYIAVPRRERPFARRREVVDPAARTRRIRPGAAARPDTASVRYPRVC